MEKIKNCSNKNINVCSFNHPPTVSNFNNSIPVKIDELEITEGALKVLKFIRPDWDSKSIKFKFFTDGITNKLVGCYYTTESSNNINEEIENNMVLIRVYGNNTDLLIDRKIEIKNIKLLNEKGFAPALFAIFNNGFAYEYTPGKSLTRESITMPHIWELVAKRMAKMHKIIPNKLESQQPCLKSKMNLFFSLVPQNFSKPEIQSRLADVFLPISKLQQEFQVLYEQLELLDSPVVFSHNDLLLGNIVYNENDSTVTFIDYEYAGYNYQAFDIGNHFTEFTGIDEIDYKYYPSYDFQMEWLKVYLKEYFETTNIDSTLVERLYVQVNKFALAAHFFWTVWALVQAENSTIDFDFVEFAFARYNEYLAKKDTFLSLKLPEL